MTDNAALANRLFDAIERGDMETLEGIYHPDAQIWHNTDDVTKHRDHTMQLIRWMIDNIPTTRYADRHIVRTDEGFVSRHTVVIPRAGGGEVRLPCCLVATVADGQVTHVFEYYDSATQAQAGVAVPAD